jgi:uncharacterized protein involved in exopolysaccharide biosynthesis
MGTLPLAQGPDHTQPILTGHRAMPSSSASDLSDIGRYARIILHRLWLIVLLVAATEGTVAAISFVRPMVYETSVRFRIVTVPPSDVTLYQTSGSTSSVDPLTATRTDFISVLTSLDVAWDTVDALKLPISGREVQQMVTVQQATDSDFIILTLKAGNPQQAAAIANGLVAAAVKRYGQMSAQPLTTGEAFIASQLDQTQKELQQARAEMTNFQTQNSLGSLDGAISSQIGLIRSLQLNHDDAVAQGDQPRAVNFQVLIDQRTAELTTLINLSGPYDTLQLRLNGLQSTYDYLQSKLTEAQLSENQALNLDAVQVFGPARVPDQPNPRLTVGLMVLSAAVATIAGVMLAFLWEYLAPSKPKVAAAHEPMARQGAG